MTLGSRIKAVRQEKGMSQTKLAHAVNVTNACISNIERDKSKPGLFLFYKICMALDITMDRMLMVVSYD